MIPLLLADITPAWLTETLGQGHVTSFTAQTLSGESSYQGQLARLQLRYRESLPGAPQSIIVKMHGLEDSAEAVALFKPHETEINFYRHLAPHLPVRVPRCYFSDMDIAAGRSVLLLEDLSPAQTGDPAQCLTLVQARLALESLAKMHARYWNQPDHDELAWLQSLKGDDDPQQVGDFVRGLFAAAWPAFTGHHELPQALREWGDHIARQGVPQPAQNPPVPQSLVHGDFRLDNLLFDKNNTCAVIDWEDTFFGDLHFDLAWLLGGGLTLDDQPHVMGLLQHYHQSLTDHGVRGYAVEQLFENYRFMMIEAFIQGVLMSVDLMDKPQHTARAQHLAQRFIQTAANLHLEEIA